MLGWGFQNEDDITKLRQYLWNHRSKIALGALCAAGAGAAIYYYFQSGTDHVEDSGKLLVKNSNSQQDDRQRVNSNKLVITRRIFLRNE